MELEQPFVATRAVEQAVDVHVVAHVPVLAGLEHEARPRDREVHSPHRTRERRERGREEENVRHAAWHRAQDILDVTNKTTTPSAQSRTTSSIVDSSEITRNSPRKYEIVSLFNHRE